MGFIIGRNFRVEGLFARLMYRRFTRCTEYALHGGRWIFFAILARGLSRRAEPEVKLH